MKTFQVAQGDGGKRLDTYLRESLSKYSGKKIQDALHRHFCFVNGQKHRFASYRVQEGDSIVIEESFLEEKLTVFSEEMILYEDEFFYVVSKPPYLESKEGTLSSYFQRPAFLVHRLDKMTSGVMIIAKTEITQRKLEILFKNSLVKKTYYAIAKKIQGKPRFSVSKPIKKVKSFDGGGVFAISEKGAMAKTTFEVVDSNTKFSVVKCFPVTGKTHQIRLHLMDYGYPIVGDYEYGYRRYEKGVTRFLLHSHSVEFIHPHTLKNFSCSEVLPEDFSLFLNVHNLEI